jgi:hypothetical protein
VAVVRSFEERFGKPPLQGTSKNGDFGVMHGA